MNKGGYVYVVLREPSLAVVGVSLSLDRVKIMLASAGYDLVDQCVGWWQYADADGACCWVQFVTVASTNGDWFNFDHPTVGTHGAGCRCRSLECGRGHCDGCECPDFGQYGDCPPF